MYTLLKEMELHKTHYDCLDEIETYLPIAVVICRQGLITKSRDKLLSVKLNISRSWKANYTKIQLDASYEFFGNMNFFESKRKCMKDGRITQRTKANFEPRFQSVSFSLRFQSFMGDCEETFCPSHSP
jgi:hypothetical protein